MWPTFFCYGEDFSQRFWLRNHPSKKGRKGSKLGDFVEEFLHFDTIKKNERAAIYQYILPLF
jgi:hypothetical protein